MRPQDARRHVFRALDAALPRRGPIAVAFSGGPDSTALLRSIAAHADRPEEVLAVHIDHGLDPGSGARARAAAELADEAGVPFVLRHAPVRPSTGRGLEADARDARYRALARTADEFGCEEVWTAHHLDDQAETVLLRLSRGSGPLGLGGIAPLAGRWRRPLLDIPRSVLVASLEPGRPSPVDDPTNRDLDRPRNRLRHEVLPDWTAVVPELPRDLASLAHAARAAGERLHRQGVAQLGIVTAPWGARLDLRAFLDLPPTLRHVALSSLHRVAGASWPARAKSRAELEAQLGRGRSVRCDAGAGWIWEADRREIRLVRPGTEPGPYSYTLRTLPARCVVREIAARVTLEPSPPLPWMTTGRPAEAGLRLPPAPRLEIRNRRHGDRVLPSGRTTTRKLKEIFSDRGVPRVERDRLPLLVVDDEIAWIPGVGVSEPFRFDPSDAVVWKVSLEWAPSAGVRASESFVGSFGLDRA